MVAAWRPWRLSPLPVKVGVLSMAGSQRTPVPFDVERVVMRALEKEPDARFQSARDMEAALGQCKDSLGWSGEQARAFWTSVESKPRSGVETKPGGEDDAKTLARPSVSRAMKAG
jgi:hypothetical protein